MEEAFEEFLAGESPHHVAAYFDADVLSDAATLAEESYATAVDGGVRIVVPGEAGQAAFESATGIDPMDFAGEAMGATGAVDRTLAQGDCPGDGEDHAVRIAFAFAEEQRESAGGLYAEGDVIHAYVQCGCGTAYSEKWIAGRD